jgi:putative PIN family toxin of toxin-antitoxin system
MTVVLDCNILVICLTSRSPYHNIYKALVGGKFTLAVTNDILLEYQEIIEQKYGLTTANAFIALLNELPNVVQVTAYYQWRLLTADEEDNKYCDCAIAVNADHLVTEDKHFDVLKRLSFPRIHIVSIDDFATLA